MRFLLFAAAIALAPSAHAEEPAATTRDETETLLSGDVEHGGYGGPMLQITQIMDTTSVLVGGRGAWLIGHRLAIGGGGYGLASDIRVRDPSVDQTRYVGLGYGGLYLSYVLLPEKLVHVSVDALVGGGSVTYNRRYTSGERVSDDDGDGFFVAELGASVELNVARWMRFSVSPSYRLVNGVRYRAVRSDDVRGPGIAFVLDFGRF